MTTRPPKTIVEPTALGTVANTNTKLLIYRLFQKGRVLAQDGVVGEGKEGGSEQSRQKKMFRKSKSARVRVEHITIEKCRRVARELMVDPGDGPYIQGRIPVAANMVLRSKRERIGSDHGEPRIKQQGKPESTRSAARRPNQIRASLVRIEVEVRESIGYLAHGTSPRLYPVPDPRSLPMRLRFCLFFGCPSSLLIQREWYRWWPYDERRNPGRRARALAEITRSMGRGAGQRNREGPQQSTRSD